MNIDAGIPKRGGKVVYSAWHYGILESDIDDHAMQDLLIQFLYLLQFYLDAGGDTSSTRCLKILQALCRNYTRFGNITYPRPVASGFFGTRRIPGFDNGIISGLTFFLDCE